MILLALLQAGWAQEQFQSPEQAVSTYMQACAQGDLDKAESCYTKSSRELIASQPGNRPDPKSLVAFAQRLKDVEFKLEEVNQKRAILWPSDKKVPPFLVRIQDESEGWRLDYHFMSHYIVVKEKGWNWRNKRLFNLWKSRE